MTALALALLLAGPPASWSDPFVPPVERFASYWPTHAQAPKPAPLPARKLTRADFADAPKPRALTAADARAQADALQAELAAEAAAYLVLSNRRDRAVVLSALLCDARQRAADAAAKNRSGTLDRPLALAYVKAVEVVEATELRLAVLDVRPLVCSLWPVARMVSCLGITAPAECETDAELAAMVRAAGKLGAP